MATALRSALLALMLFTLLPSHHAGAVACAAGHYRSGCVGPNGAVVRHHPYHGGYGYGRGYGGGAACARGPNGAGCVRRY